MAARDESRVLSRNDHVAREKFPGLLVHGNSAYARSNLSPLLSLLFFCLLDQTGGSRPWDQKLVVKCQRAPFLKAFIFAAPPPLRSQQPSVVAPGSLYSLRPLHSPPPPPIRSDREARFLDRSHRCVHGLRSTFVVVLTQHYG
ncbi:hypothetical protein GW17_00008512 [Ensete ventricosum]|nr:hypothetical protein GW17_00008512 [Ensete ventricosum]